MEIKEITISIVQKFSYLPFNTGAIIIHWF